MIKYQPNLSLSLSSHCTISSKCTAAGSEPTKRQQWQRKNLNLLPIHAACSSGQHDFNPFHLCRMNKKVLGFFGAFQLAITPTRWNGSRERTLSEVHLGGGGRHLRGWIRGQSLSHYPNIFIPAMYSNYSASGSS